MWWLEGLYGPLLPPLPCEAGESWESYMEEVESEVRVKTLRKAWDEK
jgi:hypothetical protein